jgi:hypothetical protein
MNRPKPCVKFSKNRARPFRLAGFKEARQRTHDQVNVLLTPEQQKRYAEMIKEREARMKEGRSQQ